MESKSAFRHAGRERNEALAAVETKHEPVATAFIGFFGNHAKEVEVAIGKVEANFLFGFAHGCLVGGLAGGHFKFAADAAPEAEVWGLIAAHEKELSLRILDKD